MKKFNMLLALLFMPVAAWAQNIESVSYQYIQYISSGDLEKAAMLLACPENYNQDQSEVDRKSILESLKIFQSEFGKVIEASRSNAGRYVTAMTACGDMAFLKSNSPLKKIIYKVIYENKTNGYIVLGFSSTSGNARLITVSHGLSAADKGSKEKVADVIRKMISSTIKE